MLLRAAKFYSKDLIGCMFKVDLACSRRSDSGERCEVKRSAKK